MRLLVDENLPFVTVELARAEAIEAVWVRDEMRAAPDVEILKHPSD